MPSSIDGSVVGVTNGGMMLAAVYTIINHRQL